MAVEVSELQNVDFALGLHLSRAFTEHAPAYGPKQYREFMERPTNQRIYRSDNEDPAMFVSRLLAAEKTAYQTPDGRSVNLPNLPVVYYFRKPGFEHESEYHEHPRRNEQAVIPSGIEAVPDTYLDILFFNVTLDYQIKIISWDKPSLEKIGLILWAHIYESHCFDIHYRIGEIPIEPITCQIKDRRNIVFMDESPEIGEGRRLWVVGADIRVSADVAMGEEVSTPPEIASEIVWMGFCTCPEFLTGEQIFPEGGIDGDEDDEQQ